MVWQVQQAETRFSDLLDASITEGPQVVTRDGKKLAVVVPIEEWERLNRSRSTLPTRPADYEGPTLKEWILSGPKIDDMMIPERGKLRHRKPLKF